MADNEVPFVDLAASGREIEAEVWPRLREVFDRGAFIGGPVVADFEQAYARFVGVRECVGVGNGTDALEFALRAAGVDAGDEVILPANTFIATAEAALRIRAVPVLVDVDPDTLLVNPDAVAAAVTERTRAIVPVHLYGQIAPVERLAPIAVRAGAVIVEDAAQSQGARRDGRVSGSLGAIAATSFYPAKNLGAAGDGGAVTTDDPVLARAVRLLGAHGSEHKYVHESAGFNSRLDAVQAVVLSAKLERLVAWNAARRRWASLYSELLADVEGVELPVVADGNEPVWHLYVVRLQERDRVHDELAAAGVQSGIHYPVALSRVEALAPACRIPGECRVSERAAGRILSLPMFPQLGEDRVRVVVRAVRAALRQQERSIAWVG